MLILNSFNPHDFLVQALLNIFFLARNLTFSGLSAEQRSTRGPNKKWRRILSQQNYGRNYAIAVLGIQCAASPPRMRNAAAALRTRGTPPLQRQQHHRFQS
jgi:hypothetical protein